MAAARPVRVVIDTNVWISFLIGKRLKSLARLLADSSVVLVVSDQLIEELLQVTRRPSLSRYFPKAAVEELVLLLNEIAEWCSPPATHTFEPDPKDSFLLDLLVSSHADYFVTGDKALLDLRKIGEAKLLNPAQFEKELRKIRR